MGDTSGAVSVMRLFYRIFSAAAISFPAYFLTPQASWIRISVTVQTEAERRPVAWCLKRPEQLRILKIWSENL